MAKYGEILLEDLYKLPKITPGVEREIAEKEDFSKISRNYCNLICKLPSKDIDAAKTCSKLNLKTELVVIFSHPAPDTKFYSGEKIDNIYQRIVQMRVVEHNIGHVAYLPAYICRQRDIKDAGLTKTRACSRYVAHEIDAISPKGILCCGRTASNTLGFSGPEAKRGSITSWNGIPVVHTLDPRSLCMIRQNSSGKFWGPDYLDVLSKDVEKIVYCMKNGAPPSLEEALEVAKKQIFIPSTMDDVDFCIEKLLQEKVVSFDLETVGKDPWGNGAKILTAQFGTESGNRAYVFTLWHRDWNKYDPSVVWDKLRVILENKNIKKIGHNIKFDVLFSLVVGKVRPVNIADTMQYLHSINSGMQGQYSLKTATRDWLYETGLGGYEDSLSETED